MFSFDLFFFPDEEVLLPLIARLDSRMSVSGCFPQQSTLARTTAPSALTSGIGQLSWCFVTVVVVICLLAFGFWPSDVIDTPLSL